MVEPIADVDPTDRLGQIAAETGCSADLVQDIYRGECRQLKREARISNFIPALAVKRVRDALRHSEETASAVAPKASAEN